MIARRDVIMGGACLAAAAGANLLRPRRQLSLLGKQKMASIVPTSFGPWQSQTADGLVQPETEGKLASRLYSEMVSRIYRNADTGHEVMLLIAYGDKQSDLLQLHRPESCYPAIGFRLALSQATLIPIEGQASIPGRRVVAERSDRQEAIIYWTRLGEYLPAGSGEQREARLLTAMQGYIPDGALFRFSTLQRGDLAFEELNEFIASLVRAVAPASRRALLGSELADQIKA